MAARRGAPTQRSSSARGVWRWLDQSSVAFWLSADERVHARQAARLRPEATRAEVAGLLFDAMQRAAREAGASRGTVVFLADDHAMIRLLRSRGLNLDDAEPVGLIDHRIVLGRPGSAASSNSRRRCYGRLDFSLAG